MTTTSDFDRSAAAWLADGPTELADRVLDAALREVHLTHQRRRPAAPWRTIHMPALSSALGRLAAAAIVAVLVVGGTVYLTRNEPNVVGPMPTPSATAAAAASPSLPSIDPTSWVPFTSLRNGASAKFPPGWTVTRATEPWIWQVHDPGPPSNDSAISPQRASLGIVSQRIPDGLSEAAWWDDYGHGADNVFSTNPCFPTPRAEYVQVTVDGQIGYEHGGLPQCNFTEVIVVTGGRAYQLTAIVNVDRLTGGVVDPGFFNAWLSTIHFDPSSADDSPATTPAPS